MSWSKISFAFIAITLTVGLTRANSPLGAPGSVSDVTGAYFFVDKPPKAFEDIDWISLAEVDAHELRVPLNGFIRLKERRQGKFVNFFLIKATLKRRAITFSTKVVRGVSYEFKGEFLKLDNFQDREIVLKGLLIKFRNGRKVAEFPTRYSYYTGD